MKRIGIADLKARLSEHLRYVRRGNRVMVCDRDVPVAQLVPMDQRSGLVIRSPATPRANLGEIPLPRPVKLDRDPVDLLLSDRSSGR
ncbi:MAG: type II toxin-antitoxin system Phd/YefM family antitoxin [Gemmatimonadales bacterium]